MQKTLACAAIGAALIGGSIAFAAPAPVDKGMEVSVIGEAHMVVANDEAEVNFSALEQSSDAKVASEKVVRCTNAALEALRKSPLAAAVSSMKTTNLTVYPRYTQGSATHSAKIDGWEASSQLSIVVKDLSKTSEIMALVNSHMTYGGVDFRISRQARSEAEAKLLAEATQDSFVKLNNIAKTMGLSESHVRMVKLNADAQSPRQPRYYALAAKAVNADAAPAPELASGESELNLRVSVEALIMP